MAGAAVNAISAVGRAVALVSVIITRVSVATISQQGRQRIAYIAAAAGLQQTLVQWLVEFRQTNWWYFVF